MSERDSTTPSGVIFWKRGAFRGFAVEEYKDLDPEALPWSEARSRADLPMYAEVAKRSRSRMVLSMTWRGEKLFAKRAQARTIRGRLSALVQGDKLRREWFAAHAFRDLGVIVPAPVLYARGPFHISYLVTKGMPEGWISLADWFRDEGLNDEVLASLAEYTRWLHALPAYHDDYRTDHLYRTGAGHDKPVGERFALIDLDGANAGRAPSRRDREEALVELFVSLLRRPFTAEMAGEFVVRYGGGDEKARAMGRRLFERATGIYQRAKEEGA